MDDRVDQYLKQLKLPVGTPGPSVSDLGSFLAFLRKEGVVIEDDLKSQFIENTTTKDKNGVKLAVEKCLVCGSTSYEVLTPGR